MSSLSAFGLSNSKWRWWMWFRSCLQAGQWLKSVGLVYKSAAVWCCSAFIAWTRWTHAMTLSHDASPINIVVVLVLFWIKNKVGWSCTGSNSVGTRKVPLKATELYRWTAREIHWKRYVFSHGSPVTLVSLRPSSDECNAGWVRRAKSLQSQRPLLLLLLLLID